jgi:redox-sensing transcriptional repressor
LGRALISYRGFTSRGFAIVGLVDNHPDVVGECIAASELGNLVALKVRPLAELEAIVGDTKAQIGVIATPADCAQGVCDRLVASGIRSILNFAPVVLEVPNGVEVRKVDLAVELQILAFHEQRRGYEPEAMNA